MYTIKEQREIAPETFAHLVSSTLYERRWGPYFVEPCIAGITTTPTGKKEPFIAATDLIGCSVASTLMLELAVISLVRGAAGKPKRMPTGTCRGR